MEKYILSVTVQNNAGVLARVSSLFGRRGYNIAERIGLVRQQYVKFSIGFSLFAGGQENGEYWFMRPKYD